MAMLLGEVRVPVAGLLCAALAAAWACLSGPASATELPRFVIYYNADVTPIDRIRDTPYTHVILAYIRLPAGFGDPAALAPSANLDAVWPAVPGLRSAGKKVMISFGGGFMSAADYHAVAGREAALAGALAEFVAGHGLDGVDLDFEASESLLARRPKGMFNGVRFLVGLTRELRRQLPQGALISHAPQPPYLDPSWEGGPYLRVLSEVGDQIDWVNVQYYNNPSYDSPVRHRVVGLTPGPDGARFPTSYVNLVENGLGISWPPEKTVVGKPVYADDAHSGHLPPREVLRLIVEPLQGRYGTRFGGLMGWQFSTLTPDHRYWNTTLGRALRGAAP